LPQKASEQLVAGQSAQISLSTGTTADFQIGGTYPLMDRGIKNNRQWLTQIGRKVSQ